MRSTLQNKVRQLDSPRMRVNFLPALFHEARRLTRFLRALSGHRGFRLLPPKPQPSGNGSSGIEMGTKREPRPPVVFASAESFD